MLQVWTHNISYVLYTFHPFTFQITVTMFYQYCLLCSPQNYSLKWRRRTPWREINCFRGCRTSQLPLKLTNWRLSPLSTSHLPFLFRLPSSLFILHSLLQARIDMIAAACEGAEKVLADTRKAYCFGTRQGPAIAPTLDKGQAAKIQEQENLLRAAVNVGEGNNFTCFRLVL